MTTDLYSIAAGTPEKRADLPLKMAYGEKVAEEFTLAGVRCSSVKLVQSPTAYTHFLQVANPLSLKLLKTACEVVSFRLHAPVSCRKLTYADGEPSADFIAVIDKPKADSVSWKQYKNCLVSPVDYLIGIDLENKPIVLNLEEVPHLLIAGASGAGKSVALHTVIDSLTQKKNISHKDVGLALIDTKQAELTKYKDSRFLSCPIATNYIKAFEILSACVKKMSQRYSEMAKTGETKSKDGHIVIVIDELADLMLQGKKVIEPLIVKIAQQGRAANIHLIVATQRPTVDVCTGHIKANLPARLALMTASARDSVNIIGRKGAESLRGKGDALLHLPSQTELKRLQVFCN